MKLTMRRFELGIWVLIFGGMGVGALGYSLQRQGESFGWPVFAVGLGAIAVGIVLIWVRSRMTDRTDP